MPIAHNLNKVTKNLSKSTGSIHIKGRKFKQLNRATLRDKKLQAQKLRSIERKSNEYAIVSYLQDIINEQYPDRSTFNLKEIKNFIEIFINQDKAEIEKYESERKKNRPILNKHKLLIEKLKYDEKLYITGFKVPNLTDKDTVMYLKNWNGTTGATTIMKFVYVSKDMKELPEEQIKDIEMK
ncbi:unnamed protein product [Candida verbasci]|uniref:Translation machinery-associated protein 16 n=1 Tax=Candida verbasci TaxID=1227364 RepID=A0A9W4TTS7_9ASCO|nr:unnamed protein product [Candida verbasci]